MRDRRFLVLHGWQNQRPPGHWQDWLTERLRASGEQVLYPQLPDPELPSLDAWLAVLRCELRMLGAGERIVIAHSLGCLLWLRHAATAAPEHRVDRVLLVCPAGPAALPAELAPFYDAPLDAAAVRASARAGVELVCTDADPWCPEGRPPSTSARWTCPCTSWRERATSPSTRATGRGRRSSAGRGPRASTRRRPPRRPESRHFSTRSVGKLLGSSERNADSPPVARARHPTRAGQGQGGRAWARQPRPAARLTA
jgi:predicted alpha/beta hydrolase family esterase